MGCACRARQGCHRRQDHAPRPWRGHPLHMVSAWATRQRLVLGQEATDAKSHESSAIPLLLVRLHLTGALGTIDVEPGSATGSSEPARGQPDQDRPVHSGARGRLSLGAESQPDKPCHRGRAVLRSARTAGRGPSDHRWRPWPDPQALGQHLGRLAPIRPSCPRRAALSRAESHCPGRSRGRTRRQGHDFAALLPVVPRP